MDEEEQGLTEEQLVDHEEMDTIIREVRERPRGRGGRRRCVDESEAAWQRALASGMSLARAIGRSRRLRARPPQRGWCRRESTDGHAHAHARTNRSRSNRC